MEPSDNWQALQNKKKPRVRWTKQLHDCFVRAVNQLGGAYEATPKDIVKIMGIKEITSNHIKSHLQKYRLGKEVHGTAYTKVAWKANPENALRRTPVWHTNETSRYIQTSKGKSPLIEGQTNFHKETEETEKLQILETAETKSAWLLATSSNEDEGGLCRPSTSMRDEIVTRTITAEQQGLHGLTFISTELQGEKYTSERNLAINYQPIDLNVSASNMEPTE